MKPAPRLRIPQMRRSSYGGSIGTDCCDIFTEYRGTSNLHDETYIRGFGYAPRFVDGLAFGRNSFGQMDPWLLERVEVIKGPAPVLYTRYSPEHLRAAADALEFD